MMQRSAGRRGGIARLASSLLFQTTALAGSLSGLPVVFPVYSRAYASSCTPASASADITRDNVATTTVVCTVPSGTLTTPQYAYGGSFTWYSSSSPNDSRQGLNIELTNSATIDASPAATSNLIGTSYSTPNMQANQYNALGAYSRGNDTTGSGNNVSGGAGGAVTIINSGDITGAEGAGIQAVSVGGQGSEAATGGAGGAGGAVTVTSYGTVSADSFGIIAVSTGGNGGKANGTDGTAGDGGAGGSVTVTVFDSIAATSRGTGIFAASYGGGGGRTGDLGHGGDAGDVTVTLGSKDTAFGGSITTVSPATLSGFVAQSINSGAAIRAISYGGDAYRDDGGNAGNTQVTIYGTSAASLTTTGNNSAGIYALSYGGRGNASGNNGGTAGTTTVTTTGGGTISTSGAYSSGIVALSLGGLGQSKDTSEDSDTANGGQSNAVSVTNNMAITTSGDMSSGIVAISAGAGGGVYNNGSTGAFVWGDQNANSYSGDTATVVNHAAIITYGTDSHGIVAQSIGGGGGALVSSGAVSDGATQTVGGSSGGVSGNAVKVINSGAITTWGGYTAATAGEANVWANATQAANIDNGGSIAILAQSIGGGGGNNVGRGATGTLGAHGSGGAGSDGGTVTVTNFGDLTTYASEAHGIVAQSIGGGGGAGRNKHGLFFATGGTGGAGGAGSTVYVVNGGTITLQGDYASGLIAQSVGGGGGTGGKATTWGVGISGAVGGTGGSGGAGGDASAINDGIITTYGLNGSAVLVQSIGGGGGSGGAAKSVTIGAGFGVSLAFGGSGGTAGDGATAYFLNNGNIQTSGTDAAAITVQSIGGGGGAGGTSTAKSMIAGIPIDPDGNTLSAAVSFTQGGSGSSGGDGGTAHAENNINGQVVTTGDGSTGILVQSIGGGGGAGGDSTANASAGLLPKVTDYITGDDKPGSFNFGVTVALGGSGGNGGAGSDAYVTNKGAVSTAGTFADGILVQSIGGGGGIATTGNGQSSAAAGTVSATLSVGLGATGGSGGNGGAASVENSGTVTTTGNNSRGVFVQSIGGGGGASGGGGGTSGGTVGVTIGLGASGAAAGDADTVKVLNTGAITTSGDWSDAILAQSIGGGGGMAGAGDSSLTVPTPSTITNYLPSGDTAAQTATFNVTSGQVGGAGGDGGNIYVGRTSLDSAKTYVGTLYTSGILSNGITAQSVGGGGGASAVSNSTSTTSTGPFTANLTLGSAGGDGGAAGNVGVYAGDITTTGFGSIGILAQSIGGGGGTGAATGFSIPSINLNLGGSGTVSDSSGSGTVSVGTEANTTLTTSGDDAFGIVAQSIGSGGGLLSLALGDGKVASGAGFAKSVTATFGTTHEVIESLDQTPSVAGDVNVALDGVIQTYGARATGVLAQSIGGGGGALSLPGAIVNSITAVADGEDGARGYAGAVDVTLSGTGAISTSGDGAFGILAQSISGGGGLLGDTSQAIVISSAGTTGSYASTQLDLGTNAPSVSVTLDKGAWINTTGAYANGIFAQALAGGGGLVTTSGESGETTALSLGRNTANLGDVTVDIGDTASVAVSGEGAWGVWTQAGATTTLQIDGSVSATGDAAGALFLAGSPNTTDYASATITIAEGATVAATAADGMAVEVGPNIVATITNAGTLQGSITTSEDRPVLFNYGTFVAGSTVDAEVYQRGSLDIGGTGTTATTTISGGFMSMSTAAADCAPCATVTYYDGDTTAQTWSSPTTGSVGGLITGFDVDMEAGTSDKLIVSGGLGTDTSGTLGILLNPASLLPNVTVDAIEVTGESARSLDGMVLPSLVFSFTPFTVAEGVTSSFAVDTADFINTGVSLTANEQNVAAGLQTAWDDLADGAIAHVPEAGGISLGQVFGQLYGSTPATYQANLTTIASETSLAPLVTATESAISAASSVMSCPAFSTTGTALTEVDCVWGRGVGSWTDRFRGNGVAGFSFDSAGLQVGGQKVFDNGWVLGGMLGYENGYYSGNGRAEKVTTDTTLGALVVKKEIGPWLIGASIGGGYTSGDSTRWVSVGNLTARAEGDADSGFVFGRLRGSYEFALSDWGYVKPMADVDLVYVNQQGYTETGAGALNLVVSGHDQTFLAATPGVEFGARVNFSEGFVARPFANFGFTVLSNDEWTSKARFAGLSGMDAFETTMPVADMVGRVGLGFEVTSDKGLDLKVQYNGNFADSFQSQSGSLRLGYRF